MKSKRINKNIYNLSKTLPGVERFIPVLESIKNFREKGIDFTANDLPRVSHIFKTPEERNAFCYFRANFFALNLIIIPMLQGHLKDFLIVCGEFQNNSDEKFTARMREALPHITNFFYLLAVIEGINAVYHYDLLALDYREKVKMWSQALAKANEEISQILAQKAPKITDFNDEELKENREIVRDIVQLFYDASK